MCYVEVQRVCNVWTLLVVINSQAYELFTDTRLTYVIDAASLLQLHISNIDELPLNQYLLTNSKLGA